MIKKFISLILCILFITILFQLIVYGNDYNIIEKKSIGYYGSKTNFYLSENGYLYISGINFNSSYGNPYFKDNFTGYEYINNDKPLKIMDNVKKIVTDNSEMMIFAIKEDNSLWVMGTNIFGKYTESDCFDKFLNEYTTTTPYFVKIMDDVREVSCIDYTTYLIKTDNTLWGYGNNINGQISESPNFIIEPVKIMDAADVISNLYSKKSTFILKNDNSLWAMGKNEYGQLGTGNKVSCGEFTKILDNISYVKCYDSRNYALSKNNTLYCWYYNDNSEYECSDEEYIQYKNEEQLTPLKLMEDVKKFEFYNNIDYILQTNGNLRLSGIFRGVRNHEYQESVYKDILISDVNDFILYDGELYILKNTGKAYKGGRTIDVLDNKFIEEISQEEFNSMKEEFLDLSYTNEDFENSKVLAVPSKIKILFNGTETEFDTYYVNGNDYINISDFINKINKYGFNISLKIDESWQNDLSDDYIERGSFEKRRYNSFCVKENKNKIYINDKQILSQLFYINNNYCCKIQDLLECLNFNIIWNNSAHYYEINSNEIFSLAGNLYRVPDIIDYYDVFTNELTSRLKFDYEGFVYTKEHDSSDNQAYVVELYEKVDKELFSEYNFYVEKYKSKINNEIYTEYQYWYDKANTAIQELRELVEKMY